MNIQRTFSEHSEKYRISHMGAKLKGEFSRYSFQRNAAANGAGITNSDQYAIELEDSILTVYSRVGRK